MIVESRIIAHGMSIEVSCRRQGRGYTAELVFEGGDRAAIDARSLEELEYLLEATAVAAAAARRYDPQRSQQERPAVALKM
jgi:hypothetical protein